MPQISKTELTGTREYNSEVPHVLPMLFVEELGCRAVLHSLPVCRIEEDKFIPMYTLYIISYFAPEEKYNAVIKSVVITGDDWWDTLVPPPRKDDGLVWWDLKHWVKEGKLFWLDDEAWAAIEPHLPNDPAP